MKKVLVTELEVPCNGNDLPVEVLLAIGEIAQYTTERLKKAGIDNHRVVSWAEWKE